MTLDVYENPDRAVVVTNKDENHAQVKKNTEVRILGGVKSPVLTDAPLFCGVKYGPSR